MFLFAAYLKAAKSVTIEAIYYGALEMGNVKNNVPAPVIDLSEFATMLDWINATDRFTQTGAGDALADLLSTRIPSSQEMRDDLQMRRLGNQLKGVAQGIKNVSLALSITRPTETMRAAHQLSGALIDAQPAFQARAQPFHVLAGKVIAAYTPFAMAEPLASTTLIVNLQKQVEMVEWYSSKSLFVQAATLAREVVVSMVCYALGQTDILDKENREWTETAINNLLESRSPQPRAPLKKSPYDVNVKTLSGLDTLVPLWEKLRELRNDIAHVGMRRKPNPAMSLAQNVRQLPAALHELANQLITM